MRDTWTYRDSARRTRRTLHGIDLRDVVPADVDLRNAEGAERGEADRGERAEADLHDLDGYVLHATDGAVGPVEEHLDRDGQGYVIVDTAGRMWGNKRLLPAGVVTGIDHGLRRVDVAMSLEDVRNAPCYDPGRRHADETWYRSLTDEYYEMFLD